VFKPQYCQKRKNSGDCNSKSRVELQKKMNKAPVSKLNIKLPWSNCGIDMS
jgi:hypothetical protein